jgi:AcrR family transcriptional regulator
MIPKPLPLHQNPHESDRRAVILHAAFDVFVEKGYEAATTAEIVRRAKTSKRTLYALFPTKQDILTALIRYGSSRMQPPAALPPPENRAQFVAVLEQFGRVFLAEFLHPERTAMYRLAIAEAGRGGAAVARELDVSGRAPVVQAVTRFFEQAAARDIVRRADIAMLISVFFSVLVGLSPLQALLGAEPMPTDAIAARATLAVNVLQRMMQPVP